MTIAHVYGTYVASRTEGISANVHGLCQALGDAGVPVELKADAVDLARLNKRRTLALGAWHTAQAARRAATDPATDLVHVHAGPVVTAAPARMAQRGADGPPVLLHLWNALAGPGLPGSVPRRDRAAHRLFNGSLAARLGLGWARDVVVSSRLQERQLASLGFRGRVHRVPNGVDVRSFFPATPAQRHDARRRLDLHGDLVLLYYGHASPWKGLHVLAEALPTFLREHRRATALVSVTRYGSDGVPRLRQRLRREGLEHRVVLRGPADVPSMLAAADLAVLPAPGDVGTACHPNVLLECMAGGVPLVATRAGSVPEVVRDGQTAVLVRPDDAARLAEGLRHLADDEALRRRLAANARLVAEERFAWRTVAQRMVAVYRQLLPDEATVPAPASLTRTADRRAATLPAVQESP